MCHSGIQPLQQPTVYSNSKNNKQNTNLKNHNDKTDVDFNMLIKMNSWSVIRKNNIINIIFS